MAAAPGVAPAVRVHDLVMSYGDLRAVDNISFEVAEGEFFGILGPNGAGKTTTLEMIEGLRRPDSGEVLLLGERSWPRNTRLLKRVGVQLQASAFFERLTALEQLRTFAALYDVPGARAEEWLERVGLTDKSGTRTGGPRGTTPVSLRSMPLLTTPKAFVRRHVVAPVARLAGSPLSSPLAGRVVLVTGASSGIGEATAKAVAERGGVVLLVARRQERARPGGRGGTRGRRVGPRLPLRPHRLRGDRRARRSGCCSEHDHVDMVVNNAGRSIRRSLEFSYDRMHDFERTMAINFFGPVRLTLGLLPRMRERRFGHVVNIVTWGVQIKAPKFAAYIASKTALDTFSRIAGRETFFDNVTFTNLRLDLVRTDMIEATDAYAKAPAKSPERAALLVVRALEDRPLTISTAAGRVGEVLNLLAPRAMDAAMAW